MGNDHLLILIELDLLDDRPLDTQQPLPYAKQAHAVPLAVSAAFDSPET